MSTLINKYNIDASPKHSPYSTYQHKFVFFAFLNFI